MLHAVHCLSVATIDRLLSRVGSVVRVGEHLVWILLLCTWRHLRGTSVRGRVKNRRGSGNEETTVKDQVGESACPHVRCGWFDAER